MSETSGKEAIEEPVESSSRPNFTEEKLKKRRQSTRIASKINSNSKSPESVRKNSKKRPAAEQPSKEGPEKKGKMSATLP